MTFNSLFHILLVIDHTTKTRTMYLPQKTRKRREQQLQIGMNTCDVIEQFLSNVEFTINL